MIDQNFSESARNTCKHRPVTTNVVTRDQASSVSRTTLMLLMLLGVSLLACKAVSNWRGSPSRLCKQMTGWSDAPATLTQEKCEADFEKMKAASPEQYACVQKCVPDSASGTEMGTCMKPCLGATPGGKIASGPKKRPAHSLFLSSPSGRGKSSGDCSATLTLDGYKDRRGRGYCGYDPKTGNLTVTFKLRPGKSLKLAGKAGTFSGGEVTMTHNVADLVAQTPTDKLYAQLPLEITDEHGVWSGDLSLLTGLVTSVLKQIDKGPVLFSGENKEGGGRASIVVVGYTTKHYGKAVPLKDLDLVGLIKSKTRSFSKCHYKTSSGKRKSVKRSAYDKVITVYERRTGKKLGSKRFKAPRPSCPSQVRESEYVISKSASITGAQAYAKTFVN